MSKELDLDGIKTLHGRAVTGVQDWMPLPILELVEAVPALIAEVEQLRAQVEQVREVLERSVFTVVTAEWGKVEVADADVLREALEGEA